MAVTGLVLTGGGARAAYQVGALKALAQLLEGTRTPFSVLAGASAGAINCMSLAVDADDFGGCVQRLEETWLSLTPEQVYRTDVPSLFSLSLRWLASLTGGGPSTGDPVNHMLDTAPLRK